MADSNSEAFSESAGRWLEDHDQDFYECLSEWVSCNSTTPNELPLQRDLAEPFFRKDLALDEVARVNLCQEADRPFVVGVWRGSGAGRNLLLNGHIDTIGVPGTMRDRWDSDPWQPYIKDGKLYGRGSSDMKAGAVAMMWAVRALKESGFQPAGSVLLELVPGEETMEPEIGTIGATHWLQERGFEIPLAIVTEPSHLEVHVRGIGQVDFSIEVAGKEIHTSMRNLTRYPQRYGIPQGSDVGVDAVSKLVRIYQMLEELERQWVMRWRHPFHGGGGAPLHEDIQGVGAFSIASTFIEGGTYEGSIPGYARLRGLINYPSWLEGAEVKSEFEEAVHNFSQLDDWLRIHPPIVNVGKIYEWPSFAVDPTDEGPAQLARAYSQVTGKTAIFTGAKFVGDAAFLQRDCGVPAVYFGPGDCSMGVHGPNEFVPLSQVLECAKVLAAMIVNWCGQASPIS